MSLSEFQLIDRFFADARIRRDDVVLGVGDDAAQLRVAADRQVLVDLGAWAEGLDPRPDRGPRSIGHSCLAHALARLAARGAEPAWATLSLTLPAVDEAWLRDFSEGLLALAGRHRVQLVGGDTTRGARAITLHTHGLIPAHQCIPPTGARAGDLIYVTGTLGATGLALADGLQLPEPQREHVLRRLELPEPPVAEGLALRGMATGANVLTDGLVRGLETLLHGTGLGATVQLERLPVVAGLETAGGWNLPLHAGEPCGLVFAVAPERQAELERRFSALNDRCTRIGTVEPRPGLRCRLDDGSEFVPPPR